MKPARMRCWLFAMLCGLAGPGLAGTTDRIAIRTVLYATAPVRAGEKPLFLDLFEPVGLEAPMAGWPAVIVVHGGSFETGSRTTEEPVQIARMLAGHGIVAAAIGYRLNPDRPVVGAGYAAYADLAARSADPAIAGLRGTHDPGWPSAVGAAVEDTATALAWLRARAPSMRVDPRAIGLLGASAGAITVLELAYGHRAEDGPPVAAVIDIRGCLVDDGGAAAASPMRAGDPPLFIVHGTEDRIVPFGEATRLYAAARERHVPVEFHPFAGAGHDLMGEAALTTRLDDGATAMDRLAEFLVAAGHQSVPMDVCVGVGHVCPAPVR